MKKALFIVAGAMLLLASCQIERRHHLGGFYVHKNGKVNSTAAAKNDQVVAGVQENTATVTPAVCELQVAQPIAIAPQVASIPKVRANRAMVSTPVVEEKAVAAEVQTTVKATTVFEKAAQREAAKGGDVDPVVLIILAIFLPPLAVYLYEGSWTKRCTVNVILTLLCGLPGMIHALIVVLE